MHLTWLRSPFPTNHSLAHMASQPISTGKHWTMDFTIIASGSLSYQLKNISDLIHGMTEVSRSCEHTASCVALPVTNGHHRDSCVASWYIVISQNQLDTIVTENDAWVSASPRSAQSLCPFCSTSPRSVQEDASTIVCVHERKSTTLPHRRPLILVAHASGDKSFGRDVFSEGA